MSRSILKQGSKIGFFALVSRVIAFVREWLLIQFLSVGETSDIFFTAFRIPNTLRKIFAEGALSSILVPAFISAEHNDPKHGLSKLTTAALFGLETIIALLCATISYFGYEIIHFIAPGFSHDQQIQTVYFLRILIWFLLFISSGAIFAAALQSQRKFFIPSIAPSILNVVYVASLCICLYFHLSVMTFCYLMIVTSIVFWALHAITYVQQGYSFQAPSEQTKKELKLVILQLIPCLVSFGISEINHFINTGFASYLTSGSMTLLRTSYQFVNIPVGIITASLVTVLLPHFSKLHLEKPQELMPHLFEAVKFVIWTTMPICFILFIFSEHIFETLFMGNDQAMSKLILAQSIFKAYLVGLLSFSLNKVLLSIFYALRMTVIPMAASIIAILLNYILNKYLIMTYGAAGIAFASSLSAVVQTIFLCTLLLHHLKLSWPMKTWLYFIRQYTIQLIVCSTVLWSLYAVMYSIFAAQSWVVVTPLCTITAKTLLHGFCAWFWIGPLCLLYLGLLYFTRSWFNIELTYFEDKKA